MVNTSFLVAEPDQAVLNATWKPIWGSGLCIKELSYRFRMEKYSLDISSERTFWAVCSEIQSQVNSAKLIRFGNQTWKVLLLSKLFSNVLK